MRERKLFALIMLLALSSLSLIQVRPVAASPAGIAVVPAMTTGIAPGNNFVIQINISEVYDMFGWGISLSFNNLLLNLVSVTEGPFLKTGGSTYMPPVDINAANTMGDFYMGSSLTGEVPGVEGSGIVAEITFKAIEVYSGTLHLHGGKWLDSWLNPYAFDTINDGSFDNTGLVGTWMNADLAGKSAWPEHHHFVISKDEDFNGTHAWNTLWGKVRSLGPNDAYLKVGFTVVLDNLTPVELYSEPTASKIPAGTIVILSADYGPLGTAEAGLKASTTAKAYFSAGGTYWYPGPDMKSFSFAVVWP